MVKIQSVMKRLNTVALLLTTMTEKNISDSVYEKGPKSSKVIARDFLLSRIRLLTNLYVKVHITYRGTSEVLLC